MNIKILLLGSAAALAMFSGAKAADAIVAAEPEPLEYVRICDAYGAGYFYIPGTETCLKVGGMVRTEGEWYNAYAPGGGKQGTLWHDRAEVEVDTANDTEFGALKTNTVVRFEFNDGTNSSKLLWANISLGGFLVGKFDSQFSYYPGYAGDIIQDDVISYGPGPTNTELNQLTYNYDAGNGFSAVVSLEDSNSDASGDAPFDAGFTQSNGKSWIVNRSGHYAPDVVAGAGYKTGIWGFKVIGGYDSIVGQGAVKARVDADFGQFSLFLMGGYNTDGDKLNKYASGYVTDGACPTNKEELCGWGDWAVWGGGAVTINDKLKANLQLAYTDSKIFAAAANLKFNPVKNLLIMPEVEYTNWDSTNQHAWAGVLRFQRSF